MTTAEAQFQGELSALVPNLRAFARSLSGNADAADDLVQETLVKAWKSRASFAPGSNLKAWLFTILRNTFLSERRKRKAMLYLTYPAGEVSSLARAPMVSTDTHSLGAC